MCKCTCFFLSKCCARSYLTVMIHALVIQLSTLLGVVPACGHTEGWELPIKGLTAGPSRCGIACLPSLTPEHRTAA